MSNHLNSGGTGDKSRGGLNGGLNNNEQVIDNIDINIVRPPKPPVHTHTQEKIHSDEKSELNKKNISEQKNAGCFGFFGSQCKNNQQTRDLTRQPEQQPEKKSAVVSGCHDHAPTRSDTLRHEPTRSDTLRHEPTRSGTLRHEPTRSDTSRHAPARSDTLVSDCVEKVFLFCAIILYRIGMSRTILQE